MPNHLINLTFEFLSKVKRISIRNKRWFKLSSLERALFSAALLYSKARRRIANLTLIESLLRIIDKVRFGFKARLILEGLVRVKELRRGKAFKLAPQLDDWVKDSAFIEYLGLIRASTLRILTHP